MADQNKEEKEEEENESEQEQQEEDNKEEEEDEDEEVEVPEKFESIVDEISEMTVTDLAELVEILEDKFGVSAQAPAAVPAAAPAGGDGSEEKEEKSSYDVELAEVGDSKIDVIKVVRDLTEKGLKDAKALVDDVPEVIMNDVDQEEAEEIKEKFEEAGASVNLK